MSILIKGMEMPTSLGICVTIYPDGRVVSFHGSGPAEVVGTAVPVPPHGRLIDADELNVYDISPVYGFSVMGVTEEDIIQASTIIEAEEGE